MIIPSSNYFKHTLTSLFNQQILLKLYLFPYDHESIMSLLVVELTLASAELFLNIEYQIYDISMSFVFPFSFYSLNIIFSHQ